MSGMLVSLLCVFSLIAIRGLNLISCDACGKDSFILESGNNHTKEAQPATCGNREDLLYENIANITFNQSSTLPALPEHIWIEVSSHQVDYISIEFMDTLINATTASCLATQDRSQLFGAKRPTRTWPRTVPSGKLSTTTPQTLALQSTIKHM